MQPSDKYCHANVASTHKNMIADYKQKEFGTSP